MRRPADPTGVIRVVAANVRSMRLAAGLSQEELAHEAGVDRTYVSQVERRMRNLTITVLAQIAGALDTTPERLLVPAEGQGKSGRTRAGANWEAAPLK
jgi:transcriptional regulator with XRE-family HTH domain